jgi:hypothetical protein
VTGRLRRGRLRALGTGAIASVPFAVVQFIRFPGFPSALFGLGLVTALVGMSFSVNDRRLHASSASAIVLGALGVLAAVRWY